MTELVRGIWYLKTLKVEKTVKQSIYVNLLAKLDMLYHFDDDPSEIISSKTNLPLFTPLECILVKEMTTELHDGYLFNLALKKIGL